MPRSTVAASVQAGNLESKLEIACEVGPSHPSPLRAYGRIYRHSVNNVQTITVICYSADRTTHPWHTAMPVDAAVNPTNGIIVDSRVESFYFAVL